MLFLLIFLNVDLLSFMKPLLDIPPHGHGDIKHLHLIPKKDTSLFFLTCFSSLIGLFLLNEKANNKIITKDMINFLIFIYFN